SRLGIWGVKFHLLHVIKNTDLASYYLRNPFPLLSRDEYVRIICDAIELLPPEMVVHRVTGDGKRSLLLEPKWSLDKLRVLATIDKELKSRDRFQGINCKL